MENKEYQACLETMFGLRRFGIKLGLSTIENILKGLDNPQTAYHVIHIAGTNGKGSVASILASIIGHCGYRVGLYTSPHLIRFNERIKINGKPIGNSDVVSAFKAVRKVHHGDREPTFFEFATAMAFTEFKRQGVQWAVVETGMGGRLDATNVVRPVVSVITNISLEHQSYLGSSLAEIAGEKAGIIKEGTPVITGATQKPVIEVLERTANQRSAPIFRFRKDFRVRRDAGGTFSYYGMQRIWRSMTTGLIGDHQAENAGLALAACEVIENRGVALSSEGIKNGLKKVNWPGRLEVVMSSPYLVLDGAHNLGAMKNLSRFIKNHLSDRKVMLVIGILDDKPYEKMLDIILPICDSAIITSPRIYRALPADVLAACAKKKIKKVEIIDRVGDALEYALKTVSAQDAVCVAGSLYVVGEAKAYLEKQEMHPCA